MENIIIPGSITATSHLPEEEAIQAPRAVMEKTLMGKADIQKAHFQKAVLIKNLHRKVMLPGNHANHTGDRNCSCNS